MTTTAILAVKKKQTTQTEYVNGTEGRYCVVKSDVVVIAKVLMSQVSDDRTLGLLNTQLLKMITLLTHFHC